MEESDDDQDSLKVGDHFAYSKAALLFMLNLSSTFRTFEKSENKILRHATPFLPLQVLS